MKPKVSNRVAVAAWVVAVAAAIGPACLGAAVVVGAAGAAGPVVYYVRTTGDNKNTGLSAAQAFKSVDAAANIAKAGDVVYVGAGTYKETVSPNNNGTAGQPVKFIADTLGTRTGDAGAVVIAPTTGYGLLIQDDDYFEFHNFRLTSGNRDPVFWRDSKGGKLIGCEATGAGEDGITVRGSELEVRDCVIRGNARHGLIVNKGATVTISNSRIQGNGGHGIVVQDDGSELIATACEVSGNGASGVHMNKSDATLTNCQVSGNGGDGVADVGTGTRATLRHCTVAYNADDGVDHDKGTIEIVNCVVAFNGSDGFEVGKGPLTRRYNVVYGNSGSNFGKSSRESTEIEADPRFKSSSDYHLTLGSAAIDTGTYGGSWTDADLDGAARPVGGGWDIGCFEYGVAVVPAEVPYFTDFELGADAAWYSKTTTDQAPLTRFAGRFGRENGAQTTQSIAVRTVPGKEYAVIFDFYAIDSWDGDNKQYGPDRFLVKVGSTTLFSETFTHIVGDSQSYTGVPYQQGVNLGWGGWAETLYKYVFCTFKATSSVSVITFEGGANQDVSDESWGIDNVWVVDKADASAILPVFTNVSVAMGFDVITTGSESWMPGWTWGDLDNDGDIDAVATGSSARVFYNRGDRFNVGPIYGGLGGQGALIDVNNDGWLDYWVSTYNSSSRERLWINNAGLLFDAGDAGFDQPSGNGACAATDSDGDGLIDLVMLSSNGGWVGLNLGGDSPAFQGVRIGQRGLNLMALLGLGGYCAAGDVSGDGFPDLFHASGIGQMYYGDGEGDLGIDGLSVWMNPGDKVGPAFADFDNDGDLDLFIPSERVGKAGSLFRNDGGKFVNVTTSSGLDHSDGQRSAAWGDFDNDGHLDLYITGTPGPSVLYRNEGDGTFSRVDRGATVAGDGADAVFVDYDNDGDLDVSISRINEGAVLLRNETNGDAYLKVRVIGRGEGGTNAAGIGVRVELLDADGGFLQRRDIGVARGIGAEPVWAHFGGVDPGRFYIVRTYFHSAPHDVPVAPGKASTTIGATTIPQMLTVEEPSSTRTIVRWRETDPR